MPTDFTLPDVGEGVAEGELVKWLVEEGDTVEEDQPIAEVETDKAVADGSGQSGRVTEGGRASTRSRWGRRSPGAEAGEPRPQ